MKRTVGWFAVNKNPAKARAACKGTLIGYIVKKVIVFVLIFLCLSALSALSATVLNDVVRDHPIFGNVFYEETKDDILENDVEITFGEFTITENEFHPGYSPETSLEVTLKNKNHRQCSYFVTIEAVTPDGTRLDIDIFHAYRLNPNQQEKFTAFTNVSEEKLDQYKTATFHVLEIHKTEQ